MMNNMPLSTKDPSLFPIPSVPVSPNTPVLLNCRSMRISITKVGKLQQQLLRPFSS